jgi:hypothetical protein
VNALLSAPREDLESAPAPDPSLDELLRGVSEAIREAEPPSALLVGPLLIIYVLLVAPLNYLVLARLGKKELSFASAAVISLLFVAAFYAIGWVYKGSQALATRGALIEVPSRPGEPSRVESVTGFFSTDQVKVGAKCPGGAVAPLVGKGRAHEARVVIGENGATALNEVQLDMWALRAFRSQRLEDLGSLESNLRLEQDSGGRSVIGEIKNSTRLNLRQLTLYAPGGAIDLGDLAVGETRKVARATVSGDNTLLALPRVFLRDLNERGFKDWAAQDASIGLTIGGFYPRQQTVSEPAARINQQLQRRLAAMKTGRDTMPALLCAISDDDPGGIDLDARSRREVSRSLVLAEAGIKFEGGRTTERARITGLPGQVIGQLGWSPSHRTLVQGPQRGNDPVAGYVDFEWRFPASKDRPVRAESMVLKFQVRRAREESYSISFWDFSAAREGRGRWVPVALQEEDDLQDRERIHEVGVVRDKKTGEVRTEKQNEQRLVDYLDPTTGRVRVRVEQPGSNEIQVARMALDVNLIR